MNILKSAVVFGAKKLQGVIICLAILSVPACNKKDSTSPGSLSLKITSIDYTTGLSANCLGDITSSLTDSIQALGACWSASPNPTVQSSVAFSQIHGTGTFTFSVPIEQLASATKYYVRAFVSNTSGNSFYSNELNFTTATISIGSSLYGGVVFFEDGTGHGLIASAEDGTEAWTLPGIYSVTSATSTLDGQSNTTAIITKLGATLINYAAFDCFLHQYDQLRANHDWFLPAKDQLDLLFTNKNIVGGFSNTLYWSSTEFDSTSAWTIDFSNGIAGTIDKLTPAAFRPIRAF